MFWFFSERSENRASSACLRPALSAAVSASSLSMAWNPSSRSGITNSSGSRGDSAWRPFSVRSTTCDFSSIENSSSSSISDIFLSRMQSSSTCCISFLLRPSLSSLASFLFLGAPRRACSSLVPAS